MPWDSEEAYKILNHKTYKNIYYERPARGKDELKKAHRFYFKNGPVRWHIVIARERNEGGVTAYVNARSLSGNSFQDGVIHGVTISEKYHRGHRGSTGDHGIAASVASLESLNPLANDVLRLDIEGPSAFKAVADWYAGLREFPKSDFNHPGSLAASSENLQSNSAPISGLENSSIDGVELFKIDNEASKSVDQPEVILGKSRSMSEDDLLNILSRQRENGAAGERLVLDWEKERLRDCGCSAPDDFVDHTSKVNVAAGFDIHSNWNSDQERFIEVKTTASSAEYFFMSENEKQVLTEKTGKSYIYIVDLDSSGKETGTVREPIKFDVAAFEFEPVAYRVRLKQ